MVPVTPGWYAAHSVPIAPLAAFDNQVLTARTPTVVPPDVRLEVPVGTFVYMGHLDNHEGIIGTHHHEASESDGVLAGAFRINEVPVIGRGESLRLSIPTGLGFVQYDLVAGQGGSSASPVRLEPGESATAVWADGSAFALSIPGTTAAAALIESNDAETGDRVAMELPLVLYEGGSALFVAPVMPSVLAASNRLTVGTVEPGGAVEPTGSLTTSATRRQPSQGRHQPSAVHAEAEVMGGMLLLKEAAVIPKQGSLPQFRFVIQNNAASTVGTTVTQWFTTDNGSRLLYPEEGVVRRLSISLDPGMEIVLTGEAPFHTARGLLLEFSQRFDGVGRVHRRESMANITKLHGNYLDEEYRRVNVYYCEPQRHKFDIPVDSNVRSSTESQWLQKLESDVCPMCESDMGIPTS